ncbi:unnamed protein product [Paramecium pentaurelia]|uniref:Uncharacterized protein n=1 Tax=Paramecium pentaurelia TaxID=43138 RepID=A0A8S1SXI3_9CILI|nr:unnamed protein product [Paramecium pentaurelia]
MVKDEPKQQKLKTSASSAAVVQKSLPQTQNQQGSNKTSKQAILKPQINNYKNKIEKMTEKLMKQDDLIEVQEIRLKHLMKIKIGLRINLNFIRCKQFFGKH